jgi:hypothetical protein
VIDGLRSVSDHCCCPPAASEKEKEILLEKLRKSYSKSFRDDASDAARSILMRLQAGDSDFLRQVATAIDEAKLGSFREIKWRLIEYRLSLNFSSTPGQNAPHNS